MIRVALGSRHSGFALLAVLWMLTGAAALSVILSIAGREAIAGARNRMDLGRAAWLAEGCLEQTRAAIDVALHDPTSSRGPSPWLRLDTLGSGYADDGKLCEITLVPAGAALNVNSATSEQLNSLFRAIGTSPATADSMVAAVLDWRDEDDMTREGGAESDSYRRMGRLLLRNAPFANVRELHGVRGMETLGGIDSILGVEPGRVSLQHAAAPVLMALPGATEELVFRVIELRRSGRAIDMAQLLESVSPHARGAVNSHYADFVKAATVEPDAWILTSRSHIGRPPITAVIEVRLERAGRRAAIVRRRSWME